jgi:V8-like Glu-specific endopeptidase
MSENPKLTADELDRFLGTGDSVLAPYVDAAAVLVWFDPFKLAPAGEVHAERNEVLDFLVPKSEQVTDGFGRGLWTLLLEERRVALRRLAGRPQMIVALAANPSRPDTPPQRILERVLAGETIELSVLSREELASLLTVIGWFDGILTDLPDPSQVRQALARFDLLAPMRRLTEKGFIGRQTELKRLEDYVFGPESPAPLFVYGTGGVGKSTLLSRFILADLVPKQVPLAYIDLDRASIRPDQPLTIMLEIVSQLRAQLDIDRGLLESFNKELVFAIKRQEAGRHARSSASSAFADAIVFGALPQLLGVGLRGKTGVLIVDTIEEAQFLGSDVMEGLTEFLLRLDYSTPLRTILAGRALPDEFVTRAFQQFQGQTFTREWVEQLPLPYRPINLGNLDPDSARYLLQEDLRTSGSRNLQPDELEEVIEIVTRNPMCLRLAARILRDGGVEQMRENRSEFFAKLKAEKIQALLYSRILLNVHGDEVRKVAYPGLIVRRITPEVIREVLAGPCDLKFNEKVTEYAIFEELKREAALVELDHSDQSLRHRVDVRRTMLADLSDHVDAEVINQIDRKAIEYYEKKPGAVARAEEIYHRLRRCEAEEIFNARWVTEAGQFLRNAGDELNAQQRLWLANRLGITLDASVREQANQESWERQVATAADRLLLARSPAPALALLRERTARLPRSRLYNLEAEALRLLGRPDDAMQVARAGVESAGKAGATDMALDLLTKMALIEETRGGLREAAKLITEAASVAASSTNPMKQLAVKVAGLRLHRQLLPEATEQRARLRKDALQFITPDILRQLRTQPVLLRETAAELGREDAQLTAATIETLGFEVGTDEQARTLGEAIARLQKSEGAAPDAKAALATVAGRFQQSNFDPNVIRAWVNEVVTSKDVRQVGTILEQSQDKSALEGFSEHFESGLEASMSGAAHRGGIVFANSRPVVFVRGDSYDDVGDPWTKLDAPGAKARISSLLPAIGRIEVPNMQQVPYAGTGFVVGKNLVMTNRHVAKLFSSGLGLKVAYNPGDSAINFRRQVDTGADRSAYAEVLGVELIHPYWDMALLRVDELTDQRILSLSTREPENLEGRDIVVIGYPAKDWRSDLELQDRIFGGIYGVKRLQPGVLRDRARIRSFDNLVNALTHDASTLGGNAGSPIIDVETGSVIGIHFAGEYLKANYGVPMFELARDRRVVGLKLNFEGSVPPANDWEPSWQAAESTPERVQQPPDLAAGTLEVSPSDTRRRGGTMAWFDLDQIENRLARALQQYDWNQADAICQEIIDRLPSEEDPFLEAQARRLLQLLRRKRRFASMGRLSEAFLRSGLVTPQIRRQYAQALIDLGMLTAAEVILSSILEDPLTLPSEQQEAHGLIGRIYKQIYVNEGEKAAPRRAQANLQRSFDEYQIAWAADPQGNIWQAINMVALLASAERRKIVLRGATDYRALATNVLDTIANKEETAVAGLYSWDRATEMEAFVALGRAEEAERAAMLYAGAVDTDAFEVASTLRQMLEVWQLDDSVPPGSSLIPILRSALLSKEGGDILLPVAAARHDLEKTFGSSESHSLQWYRSGLECGKAVCRIETADARGIGTGWLVKSTDFFPNEPLRSLVLTAAHVVSETGPPGVRPTDTWLNFTILNRRIRVKRLAWSSQPGDLDAAFVELAEDLTCDPIPISPSPIQMTSPAPRVYIIGHPGGRDLEFSLSDNQLIACNPQKLHYRASAEGGSSGSPIFLQSGWQVVGMHHAGNPLMPSLDGPPGAFYEANEGIAILAIQRATRGS